MSRAGVFLVALGLLQMTGDVSGIRSLRAVAAATAASPAPRVFSAVRGLETYSTRFFLEWEDRSAGPRTLELTPEVVAHLRGPYPRRNVFGAALAYGPVLVTDPRTRPMFQAVAHYALIDPASLLREIGVDPAGIEGSVRVRFEPLAGTDLGDLPRVLEVP